MKVWLCNLAFQNQNCQKYHNNKYKQAKWKSNNEAMNKARECKIFLLADKPDRVLSPQKKSPTNPNPQHNTSNIIGMQQQKATGV